MKRISLVILILFLLVGLEFGFAQMAPEIPPEIAKKLEVIAKKKQELDGKQWEIELRPMEQGPKAKIEKDVIIFSEGKVSSQNLTKIGFAPSNFSVRLEEDGTVIWETMQTSEKAGVAFWRGDIGPDGIMRGVLSRRDAKGNILDYNFVSIQK